MNEFTKLQVRIDSQMREAGKKLAKKYGLSSFQDLIKFYTQMDLNGNLYINTEREISSEKEDHLIIEVKEVLEDYKNNKTKSFENANDLLADL